MTWDDASRIMEHHVAGSPNVKMLRMKRTGSSKSPIGVVGQFKMTLSTTSHYREVAGHTQTITVITVPEAEAWIAEREAEDSTEAP